MVHSFQKQLQREELAHNTIVAYTYAVKSFLQKCPIINKRNLMLYKAEVMEQFKPRTVNLHIQAINKFLVYIRKPNLQLKSIKIQQKTYLENVISTADYEFLKAQLKHSAGEELWYFIIRFLGATGARISELVQLKVEHIKNGYFDLYTKAGKMRRLFIPHELSKESKEWLNKTNKQTGFLFTDKKGRVITPRAIRHKLQHFAHRWNINPKVMHPHSFRHRYAKNFIEAYNDISLLADLMGHESIETTRIYLRRTASEQRDIVDKVITW